MGCHQALGHTCLACFQDSSHCLMVPFASSSSCRSRASSAAPGPDRKAGDVPGEKLPEAKCSQMLLFMPFRPVPGGEGVQRSRGRPALPGLPGAAVPGPANARLESLAGAWRCCS